MIYYFGNYSRQAVEFELYQSPAAASKMEYILEVFKKIAPCTLISLTVYKPRKWKLIRMRRFKYDESETDVVMPSIGSPIRLIRGLNSIIIPVFAFLFALLYVTKDDTVVLYHALPYTIPIVLCKKIKHFSLCVEVEEIYGDVYCDKKMIAKELRSFKYADSFLFPTGLLNHKINRDNKQAVIIHGTYQNEKWRRPMFGNSCIHIVYAGTFDPRKGGAAAAAAAAGFLAANYHVHIIGFGSKSDTDHIKQVIAEVSEKSAATVTYDGCLSGEEYIRFIQSCDIGLSTQNPDAAFNDTSFPSKILSYMANGLRVVSIRIPAIEESAIGDLVTYYDTQTPEAIAEAILSIDMQTPYDSRARITQLDTEFQKEIGKLIEGFNSEHCR